MGAMPTPAVMRRPRVLVVSHFFPPHGGGGVHRALAWTRHLPAFGWDVTILAAGRAGYWIHDDSLLASVPPATEVLRVDALTGVVLWKRALQGGQRAAGARRDDRLRALARFFLIPDSYRAWAGPAIKAGRARVAQGDIDVVLSTSPPETAHLVGEALARAGGLPWVADFRDPWVALHYRKPPTPFHAARHRALERRVLMRADRVLVASRTHERDILRAHGGAVAQRLVFLPNGIETDGPAAAPKAAPSARRRVVSTGTLIDVPALFAFLEALAVRLAREPALADRLEVVLAGPHDAALGQLVTARGLGPVVTFPGILPHAEARALQRAADTLLFVRNEGRGYDAMVPGKLYEYLDARRPLVAMVAPGEAADLARTAGAVVVAPDQGEAAVAAAVDGPRLPDLAAIAGILEGRTRRALAGVLARTLDSLRP
jgi:glycosyltransferase involved in cell wall biosynthesis